MTREHVIADMSACRVEWRALLCGFSVESIQHDYGIGLVMFTYVASGEVENESISIQLKATDAPAYTNDGQFISIRVETKDMLTSAADLMPIALVIYDASSNVAYHIHIQEYLAKRSLLEREASARTATVHVPVSDQFDESAALILADRKNTQYRRIGEMLDRLI